MFSFHKLCVCKFNGDFLILQLMFTIKSLCILIFNSLSGGNSKHNDSIMMIFWLGTFLFIFMRIILMHQSIKSLNYVFWIGQLQTTCSRWSADVANADALKCKWDYPQGANAKIWVPLYVCITILFVKSKYCKFGSAGLRNILGWNEN